MDTTKRDNVVKALQELKGDNDNFLKIYFLNEENYTIKFINSSGKKFFTMRKGRKSKGYDCNWRENNDKSKKY